MKRILSLLLVTVLFAALFTVNANAALPLLDCGDINADQSFDSVDITLAQRFLANMIEFSDDFEKPMADFDHDGEVSVADVTWMQRAQAYMAIPDGIGGQAEYDLQIVSFTASYDSGRAAVGVPVKLSADVNDPYDWYGERPKYFEFYVDGELVQSDYDKQATVTFDSAGEHNLLVKVTNWQGFSRQYGIYHYQVNENLPDEGIVFKTLKFRERQGMTYYPTLITEAMGGTAPYSYSLKFYRGDYYGFGESSGKYSLTDEDFAYIDAYLAQEDDPYTQYIWRHEIDEEGRAYLIRDFVDKEETQWSMDMFPFAEPYCIVVQAQDAKGNLSETEVISYFNDPMIG